MKDLIDSDIYLLIYKLSAGFWLLQNRPSAKEEWLRDLPIENLIVFINGTDHTILSNKNINIKDYDKVTRYLLSLDPDKRDIFRNPKISLSMQTPNIVIYINTD